MVKKLLRPVLRKVDDADFSVAVGILKTYLQTERLADFFNQIPRIHRNRAVICKRLENDDHIPYRNLLVKQPLQNFFYIAVGEFAFFSVHNFFHNNRICFFHLADKQRNFLPSENFCGMRADCLGQMSGDNCRRIYNRITGLLRLAALLLRNPDCRHTERRIFCRLAFQFFCNSACIHAHIISEPNLAFSSLNSADFKAVFIRVKVHIINDSDFRYRKTDVKRGFTADSRDTLKKLRALLLVDKRNKSIAKLQRQRIKRRDRIILRASGSFCALGFCGSRRSGGFCSFRCLLAGKPDSVQNKKPSDRKQEERSIVMKYNSHDNKRGTDNCIDCAVDCKFLYNFITELLV